MRPKISAFRSKVGKRIFLLFISCALVPIVTLGLVSFYRVSTQLRTTSRNQISIASKSYGMELLSRLDNLESELELLDPISPALKNSARMVRLRGHWIGLSMVQKGIPTPLWGSFLEPINLTSEQLQFLGEGGTVLTSNGSKPTNIVLLRYRDMRHSEQGLLAGIIKRDYLFGTDTLRADRTVGVTDARGQLLFCTSSSASCVSAPKTSTVTGWFETSILGEQYENGFHELFLRAQFRSEPWTVVVSQSAAELFAPMQSFRRTFPFVLLLSMLTVILFSSMQIRRTLVPLERLQRAAKRIKDQKFDTRVNVNSDDEFGELASSFNSMTEHLGEQFKALENLSWGALKALARAIDTKSAWTAGHSERVTQLALQIGREFKLSASDLVTLERGGLLHDIGKIGTPSHILDKPGRLSADELQVMREHPACGVRILEPIPDFEAALPIVGQHHECFDGSGYPLGLKGNEIDLKARILSVADCYDALISDRPYRNGLPKDEVIRIVRAGAGTRYDPSVVEAAVRVMDCEQGATTLVSSSSSSDWESVRV